MEGFAFAGEMVPGMGPHIGLKATNRYTGQRLGESNNFSGGDKGLQYRFWNQAENGYASSDIDADPEIASEEAAFLDGLFKCRRQCKDDQGGHASLRDCIRSCKGKGLKNSALKTKDLEIQQQMADALSKAAAVDDSVQSTGSNKTLWIILGIVGVIIIAAIIFFIMRRKKAEEGMAI